MSDWIDLTHPINADMAIYREADYSDPTFVSEQWSSVAQEGFEVWHLSLGTQTGTHMDAPSHFLGGAPTMDALIPGDCVGRYFYLSEHALSGSRPLPLAEYRQERMIFLDARNGLTAPLGVLRAVLNLPAPIWIMAGALVADDADPFWLNRSLAEAGKYLVEDLALDQIHRVSSHGEAIALPLRLTGVSGSPTRVLVRNLP